MFLLGTSSDSPPDVTTHLVDLFLRWVVKVFYVASTNPKKSEHSLELGSVRIDCSQVGLTLLDLANAAHHAVNVCLALGRHLLLP